MSRVAWLVAFVALSSISCAGSGADEGKEPAAPDDTAARNAASPNGAGSDGASSGDVQSGSFVSDGVDGLRLEMSNGATPRSYRCNNTCSAVCTDCLFEACMATSAAPERCVRSRDACNRSCNLCPQGGTAIACYSPCLKGEPTCYVNLDIVMPDDVMPDDVMPGDVMPEREQAQGEQSTPGDETQPSNDSTPSSSSSRGNSGRPEN